MLVGILDGLPAGIPIEQNVVDHDLRRRMSGHGRGKRMKIESDAARFVGGIRHGETIGAPVAWLIENRDWPNWENVMGSAPVESGGIAESGNSPSAVEARSISRPRPGHADLAGGQKYDRADLRDILERASARETASRVAAGAVARQLLRELGIEIVSHVTRIGSATFRENSRTVTFEAAAGVDGSPVRCADADVENAMITAIDAAHDELETLGGSFEVIAQGAPPGLGSHAQWDRRLEARLAMALLSIQAQKGVEVGPATWVAGQPGSKAHDPIYPDGAGGFTRRTNHAGGTEGGMTYGDELRLTVHMKPLATLRQPLDSVDIASGEEVQAVVQRSDVCAVPAAAVVGEAMVALVLADACLEKFGGDSLGETRRNADAYREQLGRYPSSAD